MKLVLPPHHPHRETHAEDRSPAAGLHVPELHVAEDATGRRPVQVRWTDGQTDGQLSQGGQVRTKTDAFCHFCLFLADRSH